MDQVFAIMRGYRKLKINTKLDFLVKLKDSLSKGGIQKKTEVLNCPFIIDTNLPAVAIRQYYFSKIISAIRFNKAVLRSCGLDIKLSYPLPVNAQEIIIEQGLPVNKPRSSLLWLFVLIKYYLMGVYIYFREAKKNSLWSSSIINTIQHVRFYGLSQHFPVNGVQNSYDTVSWFLEKEDKDDFEVVIHNTSNVADYIFKDVSICYSKDEIPNIKNKYHAMKFLVFGGGMIVYALIKLLLGQWQYVFMLGELIKALKVQYIDKDALPVKCYFSNSEWLYRPLWTYVAETKGSKMLFYFYSTNTEQFKLESDYPLQPNNWNLCTWSNYLVWDKYQRDFIKREVGIRSNVEIVGSIWGTDCNKKIDEKVRDGVAVFDVQPMKDDIYQYLALQYEYYIPDVVCTFIKDIREVLSYAGKNMVLKRKRDAGDTVHSKYEKFISSMCNENDVIMVNPCISAIRVIEACHSVISLPFTSTAILGKEAGKPSIYYDPTGKIQKDDRAAHGVPVISGKEELQQWVSQTIYRDEEINI